MKALLLSLLLATTLHAEGQVVWIQLPSEGPPVVPTRSLSLTLSDVIDVLGDYRVVYDHSEAFCGLYAGLTMYTARTITICGEMDQAQRRSTMIHELLHVVSMRRSIKAEDQYTEAEIKEATERIYLELFGAGFR